MSFALSKVVNTSKVFLTRMSEVTGRLDPFYFRPELVTLEKRIRRVTQHRLRDYVVRMAGGATPSTTDSDTHYTDGAEGVPFIRVHNLSTTGRLNLDDYKRITRRTHERLLARSKLSGGELLVKITGVGRMAVASVVPDDFEGNINQHIVAIRTKDTQTSETLAAYLNLDIAEHLASRRSTGGTRPALDYPALLSIPIIFDERIPKLIGAAIERQQGKIIQAQKLLNRVDTIMLGELGIHLPKAPENSVKNRIFMMQFGELSGQRLDPFRYHIYQRQLREVVKSKAKRFKKLRNCLLHIVSGDWGEDDVVDFDETMFERCLVIRNTEFDNDFNLKFENGREKLRLINRPKLRYLDLRPYDLLVEKSGGSIDQPVGRVAILEPGHFGVTPLCFSNFIMKLRVDANIVDPEFLFLWLKTVHRVGITQSMQAQTSGLRNLIVDEYLDQEVPVPEIKEQVAIKNRIVAIHNEAKQLLQAADNELVDAKREIEALILGKKVGT